MSPRRVDLSMQSPSEHSRGGGSDRSERVPTGRGGRLAARRDVLAAGALAAATLAGCLGGGRGDAGGSAGDGSADGDGSMGGQSATGGAGDGSAGTPTDAGSTDAPNAASTTAPATTTGVLGGHPAARAIAAQPTRGPDPAEATGVVVAFEDPSCTRCRAFERDTVPELRAELVDTGQVSLVVRTYPVIYPWGEPAVQALEAAYARDEAAFWGLFDHYFAEQPRFDRDNVLDRTEAWLADNTDLDAAAVVADARNGAYDEAVQTDLRAGKDAGAGRTTPHVFLFRDGEYRTKAAGSVSFDLIRSALGL